ncbi:unnamed protein product [Rhizophagus irregularis]|nr:unnamed protein product [Rhizophagus irregularis]
MDKFKEKINSLRAEADASVLRAENAEAELKKAKEDIIVKEQEIISLTNKISLLEAEVERADKKISDLKSAKEEEESTSSYAQQMLKPSTLSGKCNTLESEKADLEKKLDEKEQEFKRRKKN